MREAFRPVGFQPGGVFHDGEREIAHPDGGATARIFGILAVHVLEHAAAPRDLQVAGKLRWRDAPNRVQQGGPTKIRERVDVAGVSDGDGDG